MKTIKLLKDNDWEVPTWLKSLEENINYDNMLLEGVMEKRQGQYPWIPERDYKELLSYDPTYKGNNAPGKYYNFIMNLAKPIYRNEHNRKKYEQEKQQGIEVKEPKYDKEFVLKEELYKLEGLLKDYLLYKTDQAVNSNIMSYVVQDGIAKLATDINKAKNKDTLVSKQAEKNYRVFRKAVELGGLEVVYEDNTWLIGKLTSWKSSNCFDRPITEWCTAHNKDYYDEYLEEDGGYYYVHLNKQMGELYQLHIESDQFKDSNDDEINKKQFIQQNPQLKNFYLQIGCGNNYNMWDLIDTNKLTEENKLNSVKRNGYAIQYIKNPSEEVQLEAVKRNGYAIQYIKNPSEEVQLEAVKQDGFAIQYIKNPSEEVQLIAVKQDGWVIGYIKNPSEEVQLEAVKQYMRAIQFIDNPTKKVKQLQKELWG